MNSNANKADPVANKIWTWIDEVIIAENFCPFAKVPRAANKVELRICEATKVDTILSVIIDECKKLDAKPNIETSLIACTHSLSDFEDYLDTLDMAVQLLDELDYTGIYQLASFHPDYLFAGEEPACPSHYTNRAPFPIFHIIREDSITKALSFVDDPDAIPERNIEHARELGVDFFKAFL